MIRKSILSETPKTFTQVANERRVSVPTVWRWAQRGVGGIRLESFRQGRLRFTTSAALECFLLAINGGAAAELPTPSDDSRARAIEAAERYVG